MIDIEVRGIEKVMRIFNEIGKGEIFSETIADAGRIAEGHAKSLCPVDTGELLNSIFLEINEHDFILGATAKHAVFNEYGCYNLNCGSPESPEPAKHSGFRPFLRPAIYQTMQEIPNIFNKRFKRVTHG